MKLILLILSVLLSLSVNSDTEQFKYYKIKYIVEKNDNLAVIFNRFVYPNSLIVKETAMTQKTIRDNPQVKDWANLVPGTMLTLYINYDYLDMDKFNKYVKEQKEIFDRVSNFCDENTLAGHLPRGLKASFFYMASYGRFNQKDPDKAHVEFYQNSPITLGTSFSYYPDKSYWSYSASAYASYIIASGNNLDNKNVTVPPEIGTTLYSEYRFDKLNFTGYFGLDYERFSTFNMGEIQWNRKIILDRNNATYATIGISKLVHLFDTPFFTKLSFSKSIISNIESNPDGMHSSGGYQGYKILWYLNKKISERFYIHTLTKLHWMEGPSELSTLRVGLGFGYIML